MAENGTLQATPAGQAPHREPGQDLFVAILLDRSGSMESIRGDVIGGYNQFVGGLAADQGRTVVTLTQFDTGGIDMVYEALDAASVARLTPETYVPRAGTPLYDAAGLMLTATEQRTRAIGWTSKVLVVFITDGGENASHEWTRERVFERVRQLEAAGWGFMYLGAHADAYAQARDLGVSAANASSWKKSRKGSRAMSETLSRSASEYRRGTRTSESLIRPEERTEMET